MATHYSIFTWEIPWTEEPGWLQSMVSQTVGLYGAHPHTPTHTYSQRTSSFPISKLIMWAVPKMEKEEKKETLTLSV